MKEKPILFSAPMVRAILDGSKTQTRRVVKKSELCTYFTTSEGRYTFRKPEKENGQIGVHYKCCPYGKVSARLWVRENFKITEAYAGYDNSGGHDDDFADGYAVIEYPADGNKVDVSELGVRQDGVDEGKQAERFCKRGTITPSICMPRWACRIELEITAIRVERLQDISRGDAMAEGCPFPNLNGKQIGKTDPVGWFRDLWQLINGAQSWVDNPWVWVVEFKRVTP